MLVVTSILKNLTSSKPEMICTFLLRFADEAVWCCSTTTALIAADPCISDIGISDKDVSTSFPWRGSKYSEKVLRKDSRPLIHRSGRVTAILDADSSTPIRLCEKEYTCSDVLMLKSSFLILVLSVSHAQLSEPKIFGEGVISTRDYESSITLAPDGSVAYFVKSTPDLSFRVIVMSRLEKGKWTTPEVAPFSGEYSDSDPCFSPDGTKLYFASRRPVEGTAPKPDNDIWVVEKTGSGWGAPRHLSVNTASQETSPAVTADGTLYFSSNRPGGKGGPDIIARNSLTATTPQQKTLATL